MSIKIEKFEIVPYENKPSYDRENDSLLRFVFIDETGMGKYGNFAFSQEKMTVRGFAELVKEAMGSLICNYKFHEHLELKA